MSAKNSLKNKAIRRAEREARKGSFEPKTVSIEIPATSVITDEEGNETEVKNHGDEKRWYHLPGRADRRGNRTRGRRGKGI